jgi:hypothetical protein
MYCDPQQAKCDAVTERMFEEGRIIRRTSRNRYEGLVTHAYAKFKYARISVQGKVHVVLGAVVRWDIAPFPQVTYVIKCGQGQRSFVYPVEENKLIPRTCCANCFETRST